MQLDCFTPDVYSTRRDAVAGYHHHFAWPHIALIFGAQQIEGAGLRSEDYRVGSVGIDDAAHGKRPKAMRIAGREDAIARHHHNREGPVDLAQRVADGVDDLGVGMRVRDQLHDNFRVAGGLEVCSFPLQTGAQIAQVHQVSIVRDGDQPAGRIHPDRLRIQERGVSGGRIPRVPDGKLPRKLGQHIVGKNVGYQSHAFDVEEIGIVGGSDADSWPRCCKE